MSALAGSEPVAESPQNERGRIAFGRADVWRYRNPGTQLGRSCPGTRPSHGCRPADRQGQRRHVQTGTHLPEVVEQSHTDHEFRAASHDR
jgi:hypothetical protein